MNFDKKNVIVTVSTIIYFVTVELIVRVFTLGFANQGNWSLELILILLISVALGSLLSMAITFIGDKWRKGIFIGITAIITVAYGAQMVYYSIFGTFYTTYSMFNGAQVAEFGDVIFQAIWEEKIPLLLLFAAEALLIYFFCCYRNCEKQAKGREKLNIKKLFMPLFSCVLSLALVGMLGCIPGKDSASLNQRLRHVNEIQENVEIMGLAGASTLDTWRLFFGFEPELEEAEGNKGDIIVTMNEHFESLEGTQNNEKTGVFQGKNLIFVTAESFADFAVDPVYTPTLYKMQTEGYTFENFYTPIWGVSTSDGEYVNLQSLIPKPGVWSMKESADNYLPFTLGNQLKAEGYVTKAYHNHKADYYDRDESHPNLGYEYKGQDLGFEFERTWPESDLEMIDETTSDFLITDQNEGNKPFHVYYLTVSGHLNYNFEDNYIARKNREAVKDLQMSEGCKAYMACNMELDKAMELLIKRLDEAGQLSNTVIAIASDHYPYGLTPEEIGELKGEQVDTQYQMYQNTFILWTPGMKPEKVEKVCSNMDILPTLSNMFGLEYDCRLMMGRDIFSDEEGLVVFKDKDWITDKGTREELMADDEEYVRKTDKKVLEMFAYSSLILDKDYYNKLYR